MQTNVSEMSNSRPEIPNSDTFNKDDNDSTKPGIGKEKRSIKKPSVISTGPRNVTKPNVGLRSAAAKAEPADSNIQRPTSKSRATPSSTGNPSKTPRAASASSANSTQKRLLESQFLTKKKRYAILKKELTEKHKNALELFEDMSQIREKVMALGVKDPGKPEEIGLVLCSEKEQCSNSYAAFGAGEQVPVPDLAITNEFVLTMESKLQSIPNAYMSLCEEALSKQTEVLSWLSTFGQDEANDENEAILDPVLMEKIEAFRNEESCLQEKLIGTNKAQSELIEDLVKKYAILCNELQIHRNKVKEGEATGSIHSKDKINNLNEQLRTERERGRQLMERKVTLEGQMQKLKTKVRELEAQVSSGENKMNQHQSIVKQLEAQLKQKETMLEQRAKESQKVTRGNENTISKLEKQKETLETRLSELTNQLSSKGNVENIVQESRDQLEEVVKELAQEKELRLQVELSLEEEKQRCAILEGKNHELVELAEKANNAKTESSVSNQSSNEIRLFNELQAAKVTLEKQEERIDQLRREREEFVAVIKRAANREGSDETDSKPTADLLSVTNELKTLKEENSQLKKNFRTAQTKSDTLERQLTELHARLQAQSKEGGKAGWSTLIIELQQQNSDLKCNLNEIERQNKQLEAELSQKQIELDCLKQNQGKFLKVKEEIKNSTKTSKMCGEMDQSGNGRNADQIVAKAEELQEVFNTLENKQMQVMQLEKMVKQMEEQQDRAQAQRTRLESRIAQLEMAAKEKNHRSRGFSIL